MVAAAWDAPCGPLTLDEGGTLTARLRVRRASDERVSAATEALAALDRTPFARASAPVRDEGGLTLTWPAGAAMRAPLDAIAPAWRGEPALALPRALAVARCVSRAVGELQHLAPARFALSPAQLLRETGGEGGERWVVAPLPLDGVELADVAGAAPVTLAWLSGEALVGRAATDRAWTIGAVLHHLLVGDLYPGDLPARQRLARQLAFRAGDPAGVRRVIGQAVPPSLAAAGRALGDLIVETLRPPRGRPLDAAQAVKALDRLSDELSPAFLAGGWEAAREPARALAILEEHARGAPGDEVPWATIERLRAMLGRPPSSDTPPRPQGERRPVEGPRGRLRALLALGPEGRDAVVEEIRQQLHPTAPALAEDERLYVGWVLGARLGAADGARTTLSRPCGVAANAPIRALLLARLHVAAGQWPLAAREAKAAVAAVAALPGRGETRGRYMEAFALLYDAAAYLGFAGAGGAPDYLRDAWTRLERATVLARGLDRPPLDAGLARQRAALRDRLSLVPGLADLKAAVDAATGRGIAVANDADDEGLPWPDETWLFGR